MKGACRQAVKFSGIPALPPRQCQGRATCLPAPCLLMSKWLSSRVIFSLYNLSQGSFHIFKITQGFEKPPWEIVPPLQTETQCKEHLRNKAQPTQPPISGTVVLVVFLHPSVLQHPPLPFPGLHSTQGELGADTRASGSHQLFKCQAKCIFLVFP